MNSKHIPYLVWALLAIIAFSMGLLTRDPMLFGLLSLPVLGWYLLVIRSQKSAGP